MLAVEEEPTLGRPRVHLRETGSTNDRARELAGAGAPHGTLVTTSAQSAGRGRQGRRWSAPAGSALLMSLLLRSSPPGCVPPISDRSAPPLPDRSAPPLPRLPLIAAVAVCDVAGEAARIKWPNDVVIAGGSAGARAHAGPPQASSAPINATVVDPPGAPASPPTLAKLAGILIEGRPQAGWAVLGIGLNVAVRLEELPLELRRTAATLGCSPDAIEPTLARLLAALQRRLGQPGAEILDAWRARDALYGREIAWDSGRGRAQGIDRAGRLIVALGDGGRVALDAGEVHLTPVP